MDCLPYVKLVDWAGENDIATGANCATTIFCT